MSSDNSLIRILQNMTYDEKRDVFSKIFSFGSFSSDTVNDKLILVSLLSLLFIKMQEKNSRITPLDILLKITKQEADNSAYFQMLETLAIITEEFSYQCKTSSSYGLKSSQEIINKIKTILSAWTPF